MSTAEQIKHLVTEKYGEIALAESGCGCGPSCCDGQGETVLVEADAYKKLSGYVAEADLGLGCGIPTEFAQLKRGETVLDLGSGAGNDVFVARSYIGETGRVIGVDMTIAMVNKARHNATNIGATNVEFRLGEIEQLPVDSDSIDIVISNCVLNLVPNKKQAFAEMYRVLKTGGRFCISDIVVTAPLPPAIQQEAEMYVGCVAGAMLQSDYLTIIEQAGFDNVTIKQAKPVTIPDSVLANYLSVEAQERFEQPVISITVTGEKGDTTASASC